MKNHKYIVAFVTGLREIAYADSEQSAEILAQAEQIKKGNNYRVSGIIKHNKHG